MSEFNHLKKLFSEPNEQSQGLSNTDTLNFTKSTLEKILEVEELQCKDFEHFGHKFIAAEMKKEIEAVKGTIELINRFLKAIKT